jgi:hypothetical protein
VKLRIAQVPCDGGSEISYLSIVQENLQEMCSAYTTRAFRVISIVHDGLECWCFPTLTSDE